MSMSMRMSKFCSTCKFLSHSFSKFQIFKKTKEDDDDMMNDGSDDDGHDVYVKMLLNMQLIAVLQRKSLIAVAITVGH